VASRQGGPYLEPSADSLRNVDGPDDSVDAPDANEALDGDFERNADDDDEDGNFPGDPDDTNDVFEATNYYFGTTAMFELVDWWGNPLVYFHNRDYAAHDGFTGVYSGAEPVYEDPLDIPPDNLPLYDGPEFVLYANAEGEQLPCYARSFLHTTTANFPNLNSFQIYSWGADMMPGRARGDDPEPEDFFYPGWTAASGTGDDAINSGGAVSGAFWTPSDGNLCNWQED
jgi:hypothetical protein